MNAPERIFIAPTYRDKQWPQWELVGEHAADLDDPRYIRLDLHTAALATYEKALSSERKTADELVKALKLTIAARDERIAALEAGLRAFAERSPLYDPPTGDDEDVDWSCNSPRIKLKHLRAARGLLDGGKA